VKIKIFRYKAVVAFLLAFSIFHFSSVNVYAYGSLIDQTTDEYKDIYGDTQAASGSDVSDEIDN